MDFSITTVAKLVIIVMVIALVLNIITGTVNTQVGKLIGISDANTPEAPGGPTGMGSSTPISSLAENLHYRVVYFISKTVIQDGIT